MTEKLATNADPLDRKKMVIYCTLKGWLTHRTQSQTSPNSWRQPKSVDHFKRTSLGLKEGTRKQTWITSFSLFRRKETSLSNPIFKIRQFFFLETRQFFLRNVRVSTIIHGARVRWLFAVSDKSKRVSQRDLWYWGEVMPVVVWFLVEKLWRCAEFS